MSMGFGVLFQIVWSRFFLSFFYLPFCWEFRDSSGLSKFRYLLIFQRKHVHCVFFFFSLFMFWFVVSSCGFILCWIAVWSHVLCLSQLPYFDVSIQNVIVYSILVYQILLGYSYLHTIPFNGAGKNGSTVAVSYKGEWCMCSFLVQVFVFSCIHLPNAHR